jgi:hypothetical protein
MLNFWNTSIKSTIIHKVGNKSFEEGFELSDKPLQIDKEVSDMLIAYFLKSFSDLPIYNFAHPAELEMNDVYTIVADVFQDTKKFVSRSKDLCKVLYECSLHPKIKSGELFIAHFSNVQYRDQYVDAIGIFKSENKETFLKVSITNHSCYVDYERGISTQKLEKGCLILNSKKKEGYELCIVDNVNRGNDAQYWKDQFLKVKPASDEYHFTKNFLSVTKSFITGQLPQEIEISKADQIDLLNKSVQYFQENESFNARHFEKEVLGTSNLIKSFKRFGSTYLDENDISIAETFEISPQAVKKQARIFKSVIKLDRNFHIYIHGNRGLIEQGYDTKTRKKFYKIYFDEES